MFHTATYKSRNTKYLSSKPIFLNVVVATVIYTESGRGSTSLVYIEFENTDKSFHSIKGFRAELCITNT